MTKLPNLPHEYRHRIYPATVISMIVKELAREGLAAKDILLQAQVPLAVLTEPLVRVSCQDMIRVMSVALMASKYESIGLRVGSNIRIASLGIYGYALQTAASHTVALRLSAHYDRIIAPFSILIDKQIEGRIIRTTEPIPPIGDNTDIYRFIIELKFAAIHAAMTDLYGMPPPLEYISVRFKRPSYADEYTRLLNCKVAFGQNENCMVFPASHLKHGMRFALPEAHHIVKAACDEILDSIGEGSRLSDNIKSIILNTPGYIPDLEGIARDLAISSRTLRRRLQEEGTNYRDILASARKQLALSYVKMSDLSFKEISNLLGYESTTSFNAAFYRWFDANPTNMRQILRKQ